MRWSRVDIRFGVSGRYRGMQPGAVSKRLVPLLILVSCVFMMVNVRVLYAETLMEDMVDRAVPSKLSNRNKDVNDEETGTGKNPLVQGMMPFFSAGRMMPGPSFGSPVGQNSEIPETTDRISIKIGAKESNEDDGNDGSRSFETTAGDEAGELSAADGDGHGYIRPEKPTVYLTFDDGPSRLTSDILDILKEENVPATFFVLGIHGERYPETLRRIVKEGHAIGNHTYDHRYEELYSDFASFFAQVQRTDEIIYETTGMKTTLFRPPGGSYSNMDDYYMEYMNLAGFITYDWHVDSGDARRRGVPASEIVEKATKVKLEHQMIVLMHDSVGHEETVKALPEIIQFYRDQGYEFAVLDRTVEPKTLAYGKSRWNRTHSEQLHETYLEMARQFRERARQAEKNSNLQKGRLVLVAKGNRYILEEGQYEMIDGHFHVPLDILAEALDGRFPGRSMAKGTMTGGFVERPVTARIEERTVAGGIVERTVAGGTVERIVAAGTVERPATAGIVERTVIAGNTYAREMSAGNMATDRMAAGTVAAGTVKSGFAGKLVILFDGKYIIYDQSESSLVIWRIVDEASGYKSVSIDVSADSGFIPLRATVEALGGSIPYYSLSQPDKEVYIEM